MPRQPTDEAYGEYFRKNITKQLGSLADDYKKELDAIAAAYSTPWAQEMMDRGVNPILGIKPFATGGYIPLGDEGIVAEAGPELLRVMNGGIQVTPLSRTATNTPVGAGDKTIINNNYYNEVYATVASSYDVSRLAEDLAAEEKYIRQGRGE